MIIRKCRQASLILAVGAFVLPNTGFGQDVEDGFSIAIGPEILTALDPRDGDGPGVGGLIEFQFATAETRFSIGAGVIGHGSYRADLSIVRGSFEFDKDRFYYGGGLTGWVLASVAGPGAHLRLGGETERFRMESRLHLTKTNTSYVFLTFGAALIL